MVNILSPNRDLEDMVEKGAKMFRVDAEKTPFYRMGAEKITEELRLDIISSIKMMLQLKFNIKDVSFLPFIKNINSLEKLRKIREAVVSMGSIKEIEKFVKK